MTDADVVEQAAALLRKAHADRTPIEPLTARYGDVLDVASAWRIQTHNRDLALAEGRFVVGYKVGLTSDAMQRQMGVDEPDFGALLDDMTVPDGGTLRLIDFVQPRAEAEIALTLTRDLGAGTTADDVIAAIDQAYPSLEIIDSRIKDWRLSLIDTVADNASSGAYVLGPPMSLGGADLADLEVTVRLNGAEAAGGRGSAALGHPANAAAWLANRLAGFGLALTAGSVVLTGSLHASLPLVGGDRVEADFGAFGTVSIDIG
jgi:2-keto-4-pentenoate hydratase